MVITFIYRYLVAVLALESFEWYYNVFFRFLPAVAAVVLNSASFAETDSAAEYVLLARDLKHVAVAAAAVAAAFEIFAVHVNSYLFLGAVVAVDDAENEYCSFSFEKEFFFTRENDTTFCLSKKKFPD